MSGGGSFKAALAAVGAGTLFLTFWLLLGVPLLWSAVAGAAGYGALWAVLANAFPEGGGRGSAIGSYVDRDLAKKTAAQGRAAEKALHELVSRFDGRDPFLPRLRRLEELLAAIARDVETDPKDAPAASVFLGLQGEAGARVARLALDLEARGAPPEKAAAARDRIGKALDGLILAHERHLEHLQEDNLDELQSELDVLEESLDFDRSLEERIRESAKANDTPAAAGVPGPGATARRPRFPGLTKRNG